MSDPSPVGGRRKAPALFALATAAVTWLVSACTGGDSGKAVAATTLATSTSSSQSSKITTPSPSTSRSTVTVTSTKSPTPTPVTTTTVVTPTPVQPSPQTLKIGGATPAVVDGVHQTTWSFETETIKEGALIQRGAGTAQTDIVVSFTDIASVPGYVGSPLDKAVKMTAAINGATVGTIEAPADGSAKWTMTLNAEEIAANFPGVLKDGAGNALKVVVTTASLEEVALGGSARFSSGRDFRFTSAPTACANEDIGQALC